MAAQENIPVERINELIRYRDAYDRILIHFITQNQDKTEKDFLENLIRKLESIISDNKTYNEVLIKKDDKEIEQEIRNDGLPSYRNVNAWLKAEIIKRKNNIKHTGQEENYLKLARIKFDRLPKSNTTKKNLVKGKPFNISERYKILNELTGIDTKIEQMDRASSKERDVLLAQILGCGEQTARELRNGTQQKRNKIDEERILNYLKTFQ
jgi:hypothetical protein